MKKEEREKLLKRRKILLKRSIKISSELLEIDAQLYPYQFEK